jgi:hypothetical protein
VGLGQAGPSATSAACASYPNRAVVARLGYILSRLNKIEVSYGGFAPISTTSYPALPEDLGWTGGRGLSAMGSPWRPNIGPMKGPVALSKAALEVLAIVAYRQPIAHSGVELIRGSASDSAVAIPHHADLEASWRQSIRPLTGRFQVRILVAGPLNSESPSSDRTAPPPRRPSACRRVSQGLPVELARFKKSGYLGDVRRGGPADRDVPALSVGPCVDDLVGVYSIFTLACVWRPCVVSPRGC